MRKLIYLILFGTFAAMTGSAWGQGQFNAAGPYNQGPYAPQGSAEWYADPFWGPSLALLVNSSATDGDVVHLLPGPHTANNISLGRITLDFEPEAILNVPDTGFVLSADGAKFLNGHIVTTGDSTWIDDDGRFWYVMQNCIVEAHKWVISGDSCRYRDCEFRIDQFRGMQLRGTGGMYLFDHCTWGDSIFYNGLNLHGISMSTNTILTIAHFKYCTFYVDTIAFIAEDSGMDYDLFWTSATIYDDGSHDYDGPVVENNGLFDASYSMFINNDSSHPTIRNQYGAVDSAGTLQLRICTVWNNNTISPKAIGGIGHSTAIHGGAFRGEINPNSANGDSAYGLLATPFWVGRTVSGGVSTPVGWLAQVQYSGQFEGVAETDTIFTASGFPSEIDIDKRTLGLVWVTLPGNADIKWWPEMNRNQEIIIHRPASGTADIYYNVLVGYRLRKY